MAEDTLELSGIAPEHVTVTLRWEELDENGAKVELAEICEFAERRDFGILEHAHFDRVFAELVEIEKLEKPSSAKVARYDKLLDELTKKLIIGAPDAAIRQLPQATKADVIQRFFILAQAEKLTVLTAVAEALPESSSPDSNGSTAETPQDG